MKTASSLMSRVFLNAALLSLILLPCQTSCSPRRDAAQEPAAQSRFVLMDVNKDGKVDIQEFKTSFPNMNEQAFAIIDANNDKGIDEAEWIYFMDNHGKSRPKPDDAPVLNNIPGDPLIPPVDSSDLPLMRPSGV